MKRFTLLLTITMLIFSALSGCGSDKKESGLTPADLAAATYVGSERCAGCHSDIYSTFIKSGHPYKYQHTGGATPGTYAIPGLFPTPLLTGISTSTLNGLIVSDGTTTPRLNWSAVNYTIGGYGWKIRWGIRDYGQDSQSPWVNDTGYIWAGSQTQYNIRTGTSSAYSGGQDKKYECAICHNTNGIVSTSGYSCFTDGGTDALPARPQPWAKNPGMGPVTHGGYYSSWSLDSVQCEECHGPGSVHVDGPWRTGSIVKNRTISGGVEICAKCHIRSTNTTGQDGECGGDANPAILTNGAVASGDFISHHESYNELVGYNGDGVHASLKCTTCHDPHKRATTVIEAVRAVLGISDNHLSAETRGAIKRSCLSCHPGKEQAKTTAMQDSHRKNNVTCVDCHMAEATKTATDSGTAGWGRKGDLKTHIFRIDPTGTTITRTNADGKTIATNYITPRYACGKCHDSAIYGSVISGPTNTTDAATAADNYHTGP